MVVIALGAGKEPLICASFNELASASGDELDHILKAGTLPEADSLTGWEFKGFNRPEFTKYLGIRKFIKGFYAAPEENPHGFCGYNVQVHQNNIDEPWEKKIKKDQPAIHGFYHVLPFQEKAIDNLYPNAWLLDYGRSARNPVMDPSRCLRDYVVQVDPENPDLLLGKAYFALSTSRIFVSFFILERLGQAPLNLPIFK